MKKVLLFSALLLQYMIMQAQAIPPCTLSFETQDDFNGWTVINANEGDTWIWQESEKAATCSSAKAIANDWIISPAITLEAGKAYQINAFVKSDANYNWQDFSVNIGSENSIAGQTRELYSITHFTTTYYADKGGIFSPESDGTYYVGIHYYSGRMNGTFSFQKLEVKELPVYPAQIQDLTVTVGAEGVLKADLQWTYPVKNHLDGALNALTGAKIYRNNSLITTMENATVGGSGSYVDSEITQAGTYTYKVVAYNQSGDAQGTAKSVTSSWIGEDIPKGVTDLTAQAEGTSVTINFVAPIEGQNGGWINAAHFSYKIVRNPGNTVLQEAYTGTLPYTDIVPSLDAYTYIVTPLNSKGTQGVSVTSNEVIAGGAKDIPYSEALTTAAGVRLYTIIDGNNDGKTWAFSSYKKMMSYWGGNEADEWMITPRLNMKAGKAYKVTFQTGLESATKEEHYKNVEITIGQGNTAEVQNSLQNFYIQSGLIEEKEVMFSVPEDGQWNVGFHCHGQTSSYSIYLRNVEIEETVFVPQSVSDLKATVGENGALIAMLSWTNPTQTTADTPLSSLDKIEIYRGETLIETKTSPVLGEALTLEDTGITEAGIYTYKVITYLGDSKNEASIVTAWIGEDIPTAVTNLTVTSADDLVTLTFDAPEGGQNNGWLNMETLVYRIVRNPDEVTISENYDRSVPFVDQVPGLGIYTYTITPLTTKGVEGASITSDNIVAGLAIELPYYEPLATKEALGLFTMLDQNKDNNTWSYYTFGKAVSYYGGSSADDYLFTPRIHLKANRKYKFSFDSWLSRAGAADYKTLEMTVGKEMTSESHTMFYSETIQSVWSKTITSEFTVPEEGVWYLSIHCTGVVSGHNDVYVNNLVVEEIPKVVVDGSVITITGTIRDMTQIQEQIPECVTAVDFTEASVPLDAADVFAAVNPNCLKYFATGTKIPAWSNVVVGDKATTVSLQAGYDFNNIRPFRAEKIEFTPTFTPGWNTFALPFDMLLEEGDEIEKFSEMKPDKIQFVTAVTVKANEAYLININDAAVERKFEATDVNVPVTATGEESFVGTFSRISGSDVIGKYVMVQEESAEAFVLINDESTAIPAFSGYMVLSSDAPARYSVSHNNGASGIGSYLISELKMINMDGELIIETTQPQTINIYGMDGRLVRVAELVEGTNVLRNLTKGVYLVNNKKVIIN